MFENIDSNSDFDPFKVINELISPKNIDLKTRLNSKQIKILVKTKFLELIRVNRTFPPDKSLTEIELFMKILEYYKNLKVSYRGQSRDEILRGVTDVSPNWIKKAFIEKNNQEIDRQ